MPGVFEEADLTKEERHSIYFKVCIPSRVLLGLSFFICVISLYPNDISVIFILNSLSFGFSFVSIIAIVYNILYNQYVWWCRTHTLIVSLTCLCLSALVLWDPIISHNKEYILGISITITVLYFCTIFISLMLRRTLYNVITVTFDTRIETSLLELEINE